MRTIALTKGQVAIVDDEDYGAVSPFKWHAARSKGGYYAARGYARADGTIAKVYLHNQLLPPRPGLVVDHVNGDTLDCRRENLRYATYAGNARNSKPRGERRYKGVYLDSRGRYVAFIDAGGRRIYVGFYGTEEEAAAAHNHALRIFCPEFARFNLVDEGVLKEPPRVAACEECRGIYFVKTQDRRHCSYRCLWASRGEAAGRRQRLLAA